jgi:hypothetical protein
VDSDGVLVLPALSIRSRPPPATSLPSLIPPPTAAEMSTDAAPPALPDYLLDYAAVLKDTAKWRNKRAPDYKVRDGVYAALRCSVTDVLQRMHADYEAGMSLAHPWTSLDG